MSDQLPLLDWTPAHQRHSPTSKAAADAIKRCRGPLHAAIRDFLDDYGGATDEEMQVGLNMVGSTQRPRRIELQAAGDIVDSGKTRATRSGRQAVIWVLRERQAT